MKPLLLHRTRGVYGPFFGKHAYIAKLSKSLGNFIGISDKNLIKDPEFDTPDDGNPWETLGGWTIAGGVAHNDGAIGTLSQVIGI